MKKAYPFLLLCLAILLIACEKNETESADSGGCNSCHGSSTTKIWAE